MNNYTNKIFKSKPLENIKQINKLKGITVYLQKMKKNDPLFYYLKDMKNKKIKETFYEQELIKTKFS